MKLWLLTRTGDIGWDEYNGKVVRAETEFQARDIANQRTGDEGKIWGHITLVKCEEIPIDGAAREILASFNAG